MLRKKKKEVERVLFPSPLQVKLTGAAPFHDCSSQRARPVIPGISFTIITVLVPSAHLNTARRLLPIKVMSHKPFAIRSPLRGPNSGRRQQ